MSQIIISRHSATIQFIGRYIHPGWHPPMLENGRTLVWRPVGLEPGDPEFGNMYDSVEVCQGNATADQVRGKVVYGNIPMHLAALANRVYAVEFDGAPPRGAEYGLAEMDAAGAKLTVYVVFPLDHSRTMRGRLEDLKGDQLDARMK